MLNSISAFISSSTRIRSNQNTTIKDQSKKNQTQAQFTEQQVTHDLNLPPPALSPDQQVNNESNLPPLR